ncbi:oleate hydratase [Companilactobacillus sp.]|jgi:oleate hydratase|uniref:oleate hydratase n=1 Tax=Companilactobacillus sp. TaxID=2767905 RepID=UPI0025BA3ED6|nr:oleate hydratase [Companilactobacillus sp.]MCH4010068.1 oleate hydratase [Companilactobacillus sp.]MCH4052256.1 oleate hydratase [Companilactobacillus sp.]MCH4078010.1 oleate hydratase [Companilactobacillus sp.]MCH4126586.1 oleate hydratase [Companilactobacillus sp.]MCH4132171.1 oleate hydratase [Companilactobacillus sp.]
MYRSNGNYEAFAKPVKPEGVDEKSAYIVGSGLAGLAAATFLVRDGQMKGDKIHFLEELALPGGSMDGIYNEQKGYIIRGGREMEPHFETLWDMFRSIPSLEHPDESVLDEFYHLNKKDPSFSKGRVIQDRGKELPTEGQLTLSQKSVEELLNLALTPEKDLGDKKINEVFSKEFFESNFWLYWSTMFAFEPWASAMEMRRYIMRFVHHIDSLSNLSSLRFTKYNQYESLIKPTVEFLKSKGVDFEYNTQVKNIKVDTSNNQKVAKTIELIQDGEDKTIDLTENDLVFVTNGSITESTTYGDNNTPAPVEHPLGNSWELWENLAKQDAAFGQPDKFCKNIPDANWTISGTITFKDDRVVPYIQAISKKDPHSGSIVTSGPVSIKDSNWLYGYSISRQPHFKAQKPNELIVWVYGLFSDQPGNYIKKKITECTGIELCEEFLYHIGVPEDQIKDIAESANTIPAHMPYITSYFMPRQVGDRPLVVPEGSKNLAFIGNFAETERDTVFTTEYSVRTGMEAVYTLLNVDRGVPEVFGSVYDARVLMDAIYYLNDKKKISDLKLSFGQKMVEKKAMEKIQGTYIEELLKNAHLL